MCLFTEWPEAAFSLERDHSKMTLGIRNRLQSRSLSHKENPNLLMDDPQSSAKKGLKNA